MAGVLGIYIHIPFCKSKCDYCDFYSMSASQQTMDLYQKALLQHIRSLAPALKSYSIDSIYFGGGTPSLYGEKRLREVLSVLQRSLSVRKFAEITVECNPDSVDLRSMTRLRKAGVNRISLGMQSSDSEILRKVNRIHTPEQTMRAVGIIRAAGITNLSLDLIYGLPGQTMQNWEDTLYSAMALSPEHISCYGLKTECGTPLAKRAEEGLVTLPDDDMQADLYLKAVALLSHAGYSQYEISNFCQPGKESRHNLKYWLGQEYVGFGPGAHSYFLGRRYSYRKDLNGYINRVTSSSSILDSIQPIDLREQAKEYLLLRMRTSYGIEEWEYRRKFGLNFEPIARMLELMEQHRWVEQSGRRWHFTPDGFLLSNTLILNLLESQEITLDTLPDEPSFIRRNRTLR